ncbi:hypothetical protein U1Q18_016337 [Sarracenia purpurea var. burkii]
MRSMAIKILFPSFHINILACLIINIIVTLDLVGGGGGDGKGNDGGSNGGGGGPTFTFQSPAVPPIPQMPLPLPQAPPLPLPPPIGQKPLVFADQRLAVVYPIIQKFKTTIVSDPLGITKTWVGSDICNYRGFYCDNPPDNKTATALASVDFNGFQLAAPTLDGFLDQLPDIALFHANSNTFSGVISTNISKLPYLYELDISNNNFSGPFPTAILSMNTLSFLDIRFNLFTGSVPSQLFTQNLDALFINDNSFMQRLPDNLGNSHILFLTLADNKFTGPIPRTISKAFSSLSEVLFLNNLLTGCLPYEIGFLKDTVVFDAGNNRLTGPIPFSLGCLDKAEVLNFAGNLFYGMVPEVVCALGNLGNLSLSDNYFTQVGPICRSLIGKGVLDVRKNCVPGLPFQRPVPECVAFFARPRYCSYAATYTLIPCMHPHSSFPPSVLPSLPPSA